MKFEHDLVFDAFYEAPDRLDMRGSENFPAAISDSLDARQKAISQIRYFLSKPENFVLFGEAVDGLSYRSRSSSEADEIERMTFDYQADSENDSLVTWPEVVVGKVYRAIDEESLGLESALPLPVSMAFLQLDDQGEVLLLSTRLGFRDMLLQTRVGLFMSIEEVAKKRGIGPSSKGAWRRLSTLFSGQNSAVVVAPESNKFSDAPILVYLNGEEYKVDSERYLIDSETAF